jgi:hypothetical protein
VNKRQQLELHNTKVHRFEWLKKRIYDVGIGVNITEKRVLEMTLMMDEIRNKLINLEIREMNATN